MFGSGILHWLTRPGKAGSGAPSHSTVTCTPPSAVPSAIAEIVLVSATVELNVKLAVPSLALTAEAGAMELPLPEESSVTVRPPSGVPPASRTVTVIVLAPPIGIVGGDAVTVDVEALGAAGRTSIVADVAPV